MIKKIIFDVDNTLLDTNKDCLDAYNEFFKSKSINNYNDYSIRLYNIIDKYDRENGNYDKNDLSNYINKYLDIDFTRKDFDNVFKIYQNHATILSDDVIPTLEILSKNYEMVTLSKWYLEDQQMRLKKAKLIKYFTQVYGLENAGMKPDSKSFIIVAGNIRLDECLVIGDSLNNDIIPADELGMKTIFYNPNNIDTEYNSINRLGEIIKKLERRNK